MASSDLEDLAKYQAHVNQRGLTLDDLLQKCKDDETTNKIAIHFDTWKTTAPYLGIKRAEIKEIENDNPREERLRKVATLHKWIEKKGDEATYFNLLRALDDAENVEMIDYILDLLKEKKEKNDEGIDLDLIRQEDMRFLCGCGQCSVDNFLAHGCPNPWENHAYPILNIKGISNRRKLELLARLDRDAEEVREHFGYMVACEMQRAFREHLGDHSDTVKDLTVFILAQTPFLFMEEEKEKQLKHELRSAETIGDVFEVLLGSFVSWFNHHLLGSITKSFCIAEESYKCYVAEKLAPFLQRSLFEIPKDSFTSDNPVGSGSFVLKIDVPPPKEKLKGIVLLPLRRHVAQTLGITIDSFKIRSYAKGCFELNVNVPSKLMEAIFPLNDETLSSLATMTVSCQGLKIMSLKYGNQEQILPKLEAGLSVYDDSKIDHNSTPLSVVDRLFASLMVCLHRLSKPFLLSTLSGHVLTHKPMNMNCRPFFPQLNDSAETMIQVLDNCLSFFNYALLEFVLKRAQIPFIEDRLREYINKLECLKLSELPPLLHPTKVIANFSSDFLKVEFQPRVKSVEDLFEIRNALASIHKLEKYSLILYCIDKAKCELRFYIVKSAEDSIMNMDSLLSARLREAGITKVTFRDKSQSFPTDTIEDDSGLSEGGMSEEDSPNSSPNMKGEMPGSDLPFGGSHYVSYDGTGSLEQSYPMYPFIPAMNPPPTMEVPPEFTQFSGMIGYFPPPPPPPPPGQLPQAEYYHPTFGGPTNYNSLEETVNRYFPALVNSGTIEAQTHPLDKDEEEWPDLNDMNTPTETSGPPKLLTSEPSFFFGPVSGEIGQVAGTVKACKACLDLGYDVKELAKYFCMQPFSHEGRSEAIFLHEEKQQREIVSPLAELSTSCMSGPAGVPNVGVVSPNSIKRLTLDVKEIPFKEMSKKNVSKPAVIMPSTATIKEFKNQNQQKIIFIENENSKMKQKTQAGASFHKPQIERNTMEPKPTSSAQPAKPVLSHKEREKWKCNFQQRIENTVLEDEEYFHSELSRRNYRDKFYHLLCYEESEHISLLSERCDGLYDFIFIGEEDRFQGHVVKLGCIRGMDGDQIQYASQASEALFFVNPDTKEDICTANLSDVNYYHVIDEDFQIEMSLEATRNFHEANLKKIRGTWYRVDIEFEVKHSYFNSLHRAVISVPESVIIKLLPDNKLASTKRPPVVPVLKPVCEEEKNLSVDQFGQFQALEAIMKHSSSVPIIVTGPFGSGKTRILARSAFEFGKVGVNKRIKTRILICAHHSNTVNAYRNFLSAAFYNMQRVKIIQIMRKNDKYYQQTRDPNLLNRTVWDFKQDIRNGDYMKDFCIIVITTYMTSLNVSDILSSQGCVFTHILLDEAAQVREPEAISSLCAASASTKVVISGDNKQVGPYVLVLGEEAREHGLKKSLLERLEECYHKAGPPLSQHILPLQINYRCHPILTKLLSDVMYSYPVSCGVSNVFTHPANPQSPCVFHCYSAEKQQSLPFERMMELEAEAVIGQVSKYFEEFPHSNGWKQCSLRDVCIISSNRNMLNLIKKKLPFRQVQLLPSYVVQGHEFQAVFLSTLEHLDIDGRSSNPTKSLVTPRIFNTVLSRSKSLVVAVGNPFTLLALEKKMESSEKCWEKYLELCLTTKSITYDRKLLSKEINIERELCSEVGVAYSLLPSPSRPRNPRAASVSNKPVTGYSMPPAPSNPLPQYQPKRGSHVVESTEAPADSWHLISKARERPSSHSRWQQENKHGGKQAWGSPRDQKFPTRVGDVIYFKGDHSTHKPVSKQKHEGRSRPRPSSADAGGHYRPSDVSMGDYLSSSLLQQQKRNQQFGTRRKKKK